MLSLATVRRRGVACIAALALLCVQAIGLAHAVAHPHANGGVAVGTINDRQHNAFDAQHDEGSLQCQLFDQLSHADSATPSLQGWTFAAPVAAFVPSPASPVHAICACGYHARGPPIFLA